MVYVSCTRLNKHQIKRAVSPVRVTALKKPVLAPSSEPWYSGKDADINNDYDSYDDGQQIISKR
jgi:hypothetical protein